MAYLVGIQQPNGDWDNFLLPHVPRLGVTLTDVLGRQVPKIRYFEAYGPLDKEAAIRMATALRGIRKENRHNVFLKKSQGLTKVAWAGRMI